MKDNWQNTKYSWPVSSICLSSSWTYFYVPTWASCEEGLTALKDVPLLFFSNNPTDNARNVAISILLPLMYNILLDVIYHVGNILSD